jgi:hypothetical protein
MAFMLSPFLPSPSTTDYLTKHEHSSNSHGIPSLELSDAVLSADSLQSTVDHPEHTQGCSQGMLDVAGRSTLSNSASGLHQPPEGIGLNVQDGEVGTHGILRGMQLLGVYLPRHIAAKVEGQGSGLSPMERFLQENSSCNAAVREGAPDLVKTDGEGALSSCRGTAGSWQAPKA